MKKQISREPSVGEMKVGISQVESKAKLVARNVLRPTLAAASNIQGFDRWVSSDIDLPALVAELDSQCRDVKHGDLTRPESILVAQAHTLDAIFNHLAKHASRNADRIDHLERLLRLAFKAQGQCRATLETLAAIKNPPMVYAKQANIANGPQQVNNGMPSLAREIENVQNKLLEDQDGEWVDNRTTGAAVGANPAMVPVEKIDRTEDFGG